MSLGLAAAPGLIATSIATSPYIYGCGLCEWIFDSSVVLQPNTNYYFYESGTWGATTLIPGDLPGPFPGYGTFGEGNIDTIPFQKGPSLNYELNGDPVPEPTPLILLALGLLPLLIARRRAV